MGEARKVRLRGRLERTASWAEVKPDGSLEVEFYDYSDEAHRHFGNDVAYTVKVSPRHKPVLMATLGVSSARTPVDLKLGLFTNPDDALLEQIERQFADYFALKEWLDRHRIPYEKAFDSWA